ncbi:MAG: hypothetical protein WAQ53_16140 [Thiofilum sp.]|uniref:hypothetical protein n=1 Tax=Thiofilum sp. TaxID=2212733 RepID=UPI0025D6D9A2|nr:hypothetical protein [Thiofilum sp.]MBK8452379.1 hypothetical protein [Thiofilum sp.]
MTSHPILNDFETLPPDAQQQVIDFIAFIKSRYQTRKTVVQQPNAESSFGVIKVKKKVSLEQMDEAIRKGGTL